MGSLKGTPSSMTSAPASASARTNVCVASSDGSPAVMYATMPSSPRDCSSAKRRAMRDVFATAVIEVRSGSAHPRVGVHVLVAAAGEIHDDEIVFRESGQALDEAGER